MTAPLAPQSEDGARARRILVVWNPSAGSKAGLPTNRTSGDDVRRAMAEHGLGDELFEGSDEDEALARVRQAIADGYDVVVGAGGDGTAESIGRELLGKRTALGILPLGSAMNLARSLDIPRDLGEAAAIVGAGNVREIDVGVAGDEVFFEIGSIGLNAAIFEEAQRIDKGEYGSLIGLVRVMVRFRPARIGLRLDGRTVQTHALMVAVANAPYTGLGLTLAPEASLDDGLFDVTVYRGFHRWELARYLVGIVAGHRRYSPKVHTFRAARVEVDARRPLPVRADADDLGTTPVTFEVRPKALRVLAPPAGRDRSAGVTGSSDARG